MERETKNFLYCESADGGMDTFIIHDKADLDQLYGWMNSDCNDPDEELLLWFDKAQVGDYIDHRLGVCIRLKDAV